MDILINKKIEEVLSLGSSQFNNYIPIQLHSDIINYEINNILGHKLHLRIPTGNNNFHFIIYRVRWVEKNINSSELRYLKNVSYNLPEKTKMNRCNFPNEPVFYGASNPYTSLLEVIKHLGDFSSKYFVISVWELKNPIKPFLIYPFIFKTYSPKDEYYNIKKEWVKLIYNESKGYWSQDKIIENLFILSNIFLNQDDIYNPSASITYRNFFNCNENNAKIIIYPSVVKDSKGFNFAIEPKFVDENLLLKRYYLVEINPHELILEKLETKSIIKWGVANSSDKNTVLNWRSHQNSNFIDAFNIDFSKDMYYFI